MTAARPQNGPMRWTFAAGMYRKIGEGLGLLEPAFPSETEFQPPSKEQVAKAEAAFKRMRARTKSLGIALNDVDVVSLKAGRRS